MELKGQHTKLKLRNVTSQIEHRVMSINKTNRNLTK